MYIEIDKNIHEDISSSGAGYYNKKEIALRSFGPISNVNIFVGANNSGKSRFLRGLLKSKQFALTNEASFRDFISCLLYTSDAADE